MLANKISVFGNGITGQALINYIRKTHGNKVDIAIRDPQRGHYDNILGAKFAFICVPVPLESDGSQILTMIMDCLERVGPETIPIIRSTITPGTTERLEKLYDRTLIHIPEFLTERTHLEDMFTQKKLYVGFKGNSSSSSILFDIQDLFPDKVVTWCQPKEAESIKLIHNVFGAMKVTFFNSVYNYAITNGIDYNSIRDGILSVTPHINAQHTQVPGPDGKMGYYGKCFPVNVKAMLKASRGTQLFDWLELTDKQNKANREDYEGTLTK